MFMQIYTETQPPLHQTFYFGPTGTTIATSSNAASTAIQTNIENNSKLLKLLEKNIDLLNNCFIQQKRIVLAHPYLCAAAICLTGYAAINYKLCCITELLEDHASWSNWKSGVSLTHLQLTNPQELMTQLKTDLYKKYAMHSSNIFTCDYTNLFIHDLKQELASIESFIYWYQVTKKIKCSSLFYVYFDMQTIQEKKVRLLFLLDFFMAWYSKYHENIINSRAA